MERHWDNDKKLKASGLADAWKVVVHKDTAVAEGHVDPPESKERYQSIHTTHNTWEQWNSYGKPHDAWARWRGRWKEEGTQEWNSSSIYGCDNDTACLDHAFCITQHSSGHLGANIILERTVSGNVSHSLVSPETSCCHYHFTHPRPVLNHTGRSSSFSCQQG